MKQQTLSGIDKFGKTTRRAQFLSDMDRIFHGRSLPRRSRRSMRKGAKQADGR